MKYLACLLLRNGGNMGRRFFDNEEAARTWMKAQQLPPWALAWWLEVYGEDGFIMWSQQV